MNDLETESLRIKLREAGWIMGFKSDVTDFHHDFLLGLC
jgi:hypothetical protein